MTALAAEDRAGHLRRSALAALREGRVRVLLCVVPAAELRGSARPRPRVVAARVDGHSAVHEVELVDGRWSCSCGPRLCAHQVAVRQVVGAVVDLREEQG